MLTFAIRNKSNNFMKHQYQSNYKPNEFWMYWMNFSKAN